MGVSGRATTKPRRRTQMETTLLHALRELLLHPEGFLVRQQALAAIVSAEKLR